MSKTPKFEWVMNTFYAPALDYVLAGLALVVAGVAVVASAMAVYYLAQLIADAVRSWR